MKAKVIKTGEIVEVVPSGKYLGQVEDAYSKRHWYFNEIEPIPDNVQKEKIIDWEQRRYELTKSAMQGILTNMTRGSAFSDYEDRVAIQSIKYADAIIDKLKEV